MTVIDSYLDTLFAPYPDSPRLRSAREELHAMMEDKLADLQAEGLTETQALGRVIAEFGSLDEVAPVLGIEREVTAHAQAASPGPLETDPRPRLGLDDVEAYAEVIRRAQPLHALAVSTFVVCPVPLLLLLAITTPMSSTAQNIAVAAGLTALLVLVALGVVLVTRRDTRVHALENGHEITDGTVTVTAQAERWVTELQRRESARTSVQRGIAIGLFILCAVPIIVLAVLSNDDSPNAILGVCLTLLMVSIGVHLMLRAGWADHVAESLLAADRGDDYETITRSYPALGVVLAIYWPLMVAIFLAWSFLGDAWDISWIIWPVAGVLYGAFWAGASVLVKARENADVPRR